MTLNKRIAMVCVLIIALWALDVPQVYWWLRASYKRSTVTSQVDTLNTQFKDLKSRLDAVKDPTSPAGQAEVAQIRKDLEAATANVKPVKKE